jgi:uncharacterized protein (TIGR02145 family)
MNARYASFLLLSSLLGHAALAQTGCPSTVTDIDGNTYPVVQIGAQCWMAKNLAVTHYANGDSIPHVPYAWYAQTAGAWCSYDNLEVNDTVYGKLYNWYTVADPRGLCPAGWHMPYDADWAPVIAIYGGASTAGGALKAVSPLWDPPNADATDISGFSGLPGGVRTDMGEFINMGTDGFFWSATEQQSITAWEWHLHHDWGGIDHGGTMKEAGISCRCVYDQLVGVEEEGALPTLRVFPNPAMDVVYVEHGPPASIFTLHDALGQVVLSGRLVEGGNTLDLSALAPGAYLLRTDDQPMGVRVVKW